MSFEVISEQESKLKMKSRVKKNTEKERKYEKKGLPRYLAAKLNLTTIKDLRLKVSNKTEIKN